MPADASAATRGLLGHMFGDRQRGRRVGRRRRRADRRHLRLPRGLPGPATARFAPARRVVHIDLDAYEIAKNLPVDLGLVADPKLTLAALADALDRLRPPPSRAPRPRLDAAGAATSRRARAGRRPDRPATPCTLHARCSPRSSAGAAARRTPIVFDEALTSSPDADALPARRACPGTTSRPAAARSGVGIPGAIGVKLAHPDKHGRRLHRRRRQHVHLSRRCGPRPATTSPPSSSSATTAATSCSSYNIEQYWKERGIAEHPFPASFDLADPEIDFVGLARALGVDACGWRSREEVGSGGRTRCSPTDRPFLIDLVTDDTIRG